jgi:cell division protein FtsB
MKTNSDFAQPHFSTPDRPSARQVTADLKRENVTLRQEVAALKREITYLDTHSTGMEAHAAQQDRRIRELTTSQALCRKDKE